MEAPSTSTGKGQWVGVSVVRQKLELLDQRRGSSELASDVWYGYMAQSVALDL